MTTAKARRDWARVLERAASGTPVVITNHGRDVAAVVSMEQFAQLPPPRPSLGKLLRAWRASIDVKDLRGPDPFENIRDRSTDGGRPPIKLG